MRSSVCQCPRASLNTTKSRPLMTGKAGCKHDDGHQLYCDGTKLKPTWRGFLHLVWFMTTPVWAWIIMKECRGLKAQGSSALFMFGWVAQYGFSALWHRFPWTDREAEILANHCDHVGIFLMIAGSYMVANSILKPLQELNEPMYSLGSVCTGATSDGPSLRHWVHIALPQRLHSKLRYYS